MYNKIYWLPTQVQDIIIATTQMNLEKNQYFSIRSHSVDIGIKKRPLLLITFLG